MNTLHKIAGLAAVAALFVYALSCRPSWSPDSTKVAFVYSVKSEEENGAVAVHDLVTGTTEKVFAFTGSSKIQFPQTFWQGDRLVIMAAVKDEKPGNRVLILAMDPETRVFHSIRAIDIGEYKYQTVVPPVVDKAGNIWISCAEDNQPSLLKISPEGRSAVSAGGLSFTILAQGGGRIFYIREATGTIDAGVTYAVHKFKKGEKEVEVGLFHPEEERFQPLMGFLGVKDLKFPIAASPDGKWACSYFEDAGEEENRNSLFFINSDGLPPFPRICLPTNIDEMGGMAFSSDSKTLWLVYMPNQEDDAPSLPLLVEIHPEKGVLRKTVLPFEGIKTAKGVTFALQPAVSPDGRWLALSTLGFEKDSFGRLLLVDLQSKTVETRIVHPPVKRQKEPDKQ